MVWPPPALSHLRWNTGTWCWMIHLGGWCLQTADLLDLVCSALAFINPCCYQRSINFLSMLYFAYFSNNIFSEVILHVPVCQ